MPKSNPEKISELREEVYTLRFLLDDGQVALLHENRRLRGLLSALFYCSNRRCGLCDRCIALIQSINERVDKPTPEITSEDPIRRFRNHSPKLSRA